MKLAEHVLFLFCILVYVLWFCSFKVAIKVIDNRQVPKEFLKKFLPRELSNHVPLEPHKNVVSLVSCQSVDEKYRNLV